MGLFDKIKQFRIQISEVENSIHSNKKDFLEVYEKNIQLEKEISERKGAWGSLAARASRPRI